MENLECPHCGKSLASGVTVCGSCRKGEKDHEGPLPYRRQGAGKRNIYAIMAVLLVLLGGAGLLIFAGLLPNPFQSWFTIAIVNGEKITAAEVNQKLEAYKKNIGQNSKVNFSSPAGKKALDDIRKEIVQILIQERIFLTEAAKAKITISPQEVAAKIAAIEMGFNLSGKNFKEYLRKNGVSMEDLEKRIERQYLIKKLIEHGTERGFKKEAWVKALNARAKVEILR